MSFHRVVLIILATLFAVALGVSTVERSAIGMVWCVVNFGALCLAFIFERRRYSGSLSASDHRAVRTGETFRDPVSGAITDVYIDPASGRRAYRVRNE